MEFGVDDFLVAYGIYAAVNVHHVAIVEAAEHVDDGIGLADISQELIAQAFALGCALHEARNIDNLHRGGDDAARMDEFGEPRQSLIGHGDDTDVGFYGAEGEIGGLCLCIAQAVE